MKLLLDKTGRTYFVKDTAQDFHTEMGFFKAAELRKAKSGSVLKTSKGNEFFVFEPGFIDLYKRIRRGPQIIVPKDVGMIIAECGIGKESIVVDGGGGTGALACFLAHVCKKVVSYEVREDFAELVKRNKEFLGLRNLTVKNENIYHGIDEMKVDVIVLDVPEPWHVLVHAEKALKPGGFLVAYQTSMTQVQEFVREMKKARFLHLKTSELLHREWVIEEQVVRPKFQMLGHTGFLTFGRKVAL